MNKDRILIVGGGIIGLSIGWRLAKAGREVILFDRGRAGRAASWVSAGMLTPIAEVRFEEEALLRFGLEGLKLYPDFVDELESDTDCPVNYRPDGVLLVGITRDDVEYLRFRYKYQKDLDLPVEWLSSEEAREREPHLSSRISAAVWCPGDHQVDNRLLVEALKQGFQKAGGSLREDACVEKIEIGGGRVKGVRVRGEINEGRTVVLAAGCWSRLIPGIPNKMQPPIRPVKGQIFRLNMTDEVTLQTIVWYSRIATSVAAYLAPKDSGHLVVGATSEEMGFDTRLTVGGAFELLRAAWEAVPGLYDLPIVESLAGLRPGSRDDAPVLGETEVQGLILATGHYRKGILLAPVTAYNICKLILTGKTPDVIRPFGIQRFFL